VADHGIYNVDVDEPQQAQNQVSGGPAERSDQDVATLNSVLQRLRIRLVKGILTGFENPNNRMTRKRIGEIVRAIPAQPGQTEITDADIDAAFKAVVAKEATAKVRAPRDLAAEYLAAMKAPPKLPRTVIGDLAEAYSRFLATRDDVRKRLGITDTNAGKWVVAWVDASDNAKRLAAYLGIASEQIEYLHKGSYDGVIVYGHTTLAILPGTNGRPNPRDVRMGSTKYYTPYQVARFVGEPRRLAVIGCDSQAFGADLGYFLSRNDIICTSRPFHWHKTGSNIRLEFIAAEDKMTGAVYGTLIDILVG
jgi:hypothetical protein